jgi:glutathione synthase/RimK-type ligase-like ATP-grasp enzyme
VKVGVLGWDHGELDFDATAYVKYGREHGHDTVLFTLEDLSYVAESNGGFSVSAAGTQAAEFDAVISRAKLYGQDWQDRVERLTALSNVLGARLFDPAENWVTGYSKLLCAQRLAAGGVSVLPTRSVTSLAEIVQAFEEWGTIVVKPSFQFSGKDVERITDPAADADLANDLLSRYSTLVCMPFWPTKYGEYRLTVAGDTSCITTLKLPPLGSWRCKTLEGATFERIDGPPELVQMAVRAARLMGLTLAGVDALPTDDGYVILEVNPVPGFLDLHGEAARQETVAAIYDWVGKVTAAA